MKSISTSLSSTDQAAARDSCRSTSAKTALAKTLGVLPSTLDAETVTEYLQTAAKNTVRKAIKACKRLSNTEKATCIANAQAKAATTLGQSTIDASDFASMQDAAGMSEIMSAAKACAESNSTCDFRGAYVEASGDSTILNGTAANTSNVMSARAGAKALIKQNLAACQSSTTSAGAVRNASEIESCSQTMGTSAFGLMERSDRMNSTIRDSRREIVSDRMYACMQQTGETTASCTAKAKSLMQNFSSSSTSDTDVEDSLMMARAKMYTSAQGSAAFGGIGCADPSTCIEQAANSSASYGGNPNASRIELGFNALREAAETWCSCEDVLGSNASECEVQAKAQYEALGGNPAEWDATERAQARDVADGLYTGNTTEIFRTNSTDLIFRLAAGCSTLDTTAAHNDFLAFVTSVNPALVGYNISAPWEGNATCQMKYRVELSSADMTVDTLTSTLQTYTMTATSTTRRSTITASTSSSQTTSLCTSSCTIASTSVDDSSSDGFPVWVIFLLGFVVIVGVVVGLVYFYWKRQQSERSDHLNKLIDTDEERSFAELAVAQAEDSSGLSPNNHADDEDDDFLSESIKAPSDMSGSQVRVGPPA